MFNMGLVLKLQKKLNIVSLKKAILAIIERHQILRTIYLPSSSGNLYQSLIEFPFVISENRMMADEVDAAITADINARFDLAKEYPFRFSLYFVDDDCYAVIVAHHLAFDGWSVNIFSQELMAFYHHFQTGAALTLSPLALSLIHI